MAEYIEREVLLARITNHLGTDPRIIGKRQFADGYFLGMSEAEIMVSQAETADVEPVRHGRWIDCDDEYSSYSRCSVCGDEFTNLEADCARTNYCPSCGAKMDRGEEDA